MTLRLRDRAGRRRDHRLHAGISDALSVRPVQAALACTFAVGAALPLLIIPLVPASMLVWAVSGSSLVFLALLGSLAARVLGRPGNGIDGRSWRAVRGSCLIRIRYDGLFQAKPFFRLF